MSTRTLVKPWTADVWSVGVFGVAVGAVLSQRQAWPLSWEFAVFVVAAYLSLFVAWVASGRGSSSVVGAMAAVLATLAIFEAIRHEPWGLFCLADPGRCNWGIDHYLSYVVGWVLLLGSPIVGALLVGWKAFRPTAVNEQLFGRFVWMSAMGVAAGAVLVPFGWNWYLLGTMAAVMLGGHLREAGHRVGSILIAIVLIVAALAFLGLYGVGVAVGCAMGGSCGWSTAQKIAFWVGPVVVAVSMFVSAALIMSRPRP